jgi:hypothetical protein
MSDEGDMYGLTVLSIKQTLVSLFIILSIYRFQDNVLSISKPRNFVWGSSIISLEFTWTLLPINVEFLIFLKIFSCKLHTVSFLKIYRK